jgi:hypothetical protein
VIFKKKSSLLIALGFAWLIDGLLQLEPNKFNSHWWTSDLAQVVMGEPRWFSNFDLATIGFFAKLSILTNLAVVVIELGIGFGLIFLKKHQRFFLVCSFSWALVVWIFGEGFGMFLTGLGLALAFLPGAAIFYIVIGILAWPSKNNSSNEEVDPKLSFLFLSGFIGIELLSMTILSHPINEVIFANLVESADSEPSILKKMNYDVASYFLHTNSLISYTVVIIPVILGLALLIKPNRLIFILNFIYWVIAWLMFQSAGSIVNFTSTDIGSTPLLLILSATIFNAGSIKNQFSYSQPVIVLT